MPRPTKTRFRKFGTIFAAAAKRLRNSRNWTRGTYTRRDFRADDEVRACAIGTLQVLDPERKVSDRWERDPVLAQATLEVTTEYRRERFREVGIDEGLFSINSSGYWLVPYFIRESLPSERIISVNDAEDYHFGGREKHLALMRRIFERASAIAKERGI